MSPAGNCSIANLDHWLPSPWGTVSVPTQAGPARATLLPPARTESRGTGTMTRGRAVRPGLHWLRLTTAGGHASRSVVLVR